MLTRRWDKTLNREPEPNRRRIKFYYLSYEAFSMLFLQAYPKLLVKTNLPADSALIGAEFDNLTDNVILKIWSSQFPILERGARVEQHVLEIIGEHPVTHDTLSRFTLDAHVYA